MKAIVFAAVIMALVLGVHALSISSTSVYKPVKTVFSESAAIPVEDVSFTRFSVSGSWIGQGSAKVFLVDGEKAFLVAETSGLNSVYLSDSCEETCDLAGLNPDSLAVQITGNGAFILDGYSFDIDSDITGTVVGLASCPDCKNIRSVKSPDHGVFFIALLLLITVIGSHQLSHHSNLKKRKIAIGALIAGFVVLTAVFVFAFVNPHNQIATIIRYAASILSAAGVLTLFVLGGVELSQEKEVKTNTNVWKELEDEEQEWERSRK